MNSQSQISIFLIFFTLILNVLAIWPSSVSLPGLQNLAPSENLSAPARLVLGLKIPLHQASAQDLAHLPGLGLGKAQAMVDFLQTHGPIQKFEALLQIHGIGPKTLAKIQPYLEL